MPFEAHFDVLQRFMSVSRNGTQAVDPASVEGQGVVAGAAVSNAAFLSDIGLLIEEKPGQFKPTGVAMQFINTKLADESRGRRLLRSLLAKTWFGAAVRPLGPAADTLPPREDEVIQRLSAAARLPAGASTPSLRVLVEYLVYTGLIARPSGPPAPAEAAAGGVAPTPPSPSPARAPAPAPSPPAPRTPPTAAPAEGDEGWEEVQTNEFQLRIRPRLAAVKRLRKQLDLLEQKIREGE